MQISMDEKWETVKAFYQSKTIKFTKRLSDADIDMLYSKMKKLGEELALFELAKRNNVKLRVVTEPSR